MVLNKGCAIHENFTHEFFDDINLRIFSPTEISLHTSVLIPIHVMFETIPQVKQSLEALPTADAYVIEEQSHRYRSNQGFLAIGMELRCLEAMVYATLRELRGDPVHSIPPQRVSNYFAIGKSPSNSKSPSNNKKTKAVRMVRDLVESKQATPLGKELLVSQELVEFFNSRKKKDDLSDCLLQALAVLDWKNMSQELRNV